MKFNNSHVVIIIHRSSTISSKTRGTDKSKSKDEELNREDLALVDKIFDTLEFDEEGKVDIEKVSLPAISTKSFKYFQLHLHFFLKVRKVVSTDPEARTSTGKRAALAARLQRIEGGFEVLLPITLPCQHSNKSFVQTRKP